MATILIETQSQGSNSNTSSNANNNNSNGSNTSLTSQSSSKFDEAERVRQRMEALRKHHNESTDIYTRTQPIINEQIHDETLKYLKSGQINGAKTKSQKPRAPKRQRNTVNQNNNNITNGTLNTNSIGAANTNGVTSGGVVVNINGHTTPTSQIHGHPMNGISPQPDLQPTSQGAIQQQGPMQQITLYPSRITQQTMHHQHPVMAPQPQQSQQQQQQPQHYKYPPANVNQPMYNHQESPMPAMQSHHQYAPIQHQQQSQPQQMYAQQPQPQQQQQTPPHLNHQHVEQNHYVTPGQQQQHQVRQSQQQQPASSQPQLGYVQPQQPQQLNGIRQFHQVPSQHNPNHHPQQQHLQQPQMHHQPHHQHTQHNHMNHHQMAFGSSLPTDLDFTVQAGLECDVDSIIKHEMLVEGQLDFNTDLLLKLDNHHPHHQVQHNHYQHMN